MMVRLKRFIKDVITALLGSYLENATVNASIMAFQTSLDTKNQGKITDDEGRVTVSLTSYGERVHDVHLVIESMGRQTRRAREVVLWLDCGEFNADTLPVTLRRLADRGLDVRFCENIKSYKKLIPTLAAGCDLPVVTIDDDYIYPTDLLERLIVASNLWPETVVSTFVHRMTFEPNGFPKPYSKWERYCDASVPANDLFPVGAGGVLYPLDCLDPLVCREDLFMTLAPSADDVWFKYMSLSKGVKVSQVIGGNSLMRRAIAIPYGQSDALYKENVVGNGNDLQIRNVHKYFFSNRKLSE